MPIHLFYPIDSLSLVIEARFTTQM